MLVLSRKIGEIITIGNSVRVTVLSYDRGVVRLGIEAPKTVPVHRKEVYDKIIELNKAAAKTELSALREALSKSAVSFSPKAESKLKPESLIHSTGFPEKQL